MNRNFGYNISRVSTATDKGFSEQYVSERIQKRKEDSKYVITCKSCGTKSFYQRRTQLFDVLDSCKCNKCRSIGKFDLVQNY